MIASAPLSNEIFAANRAVGRIALSVMASADASRRERVHEAGSLRVRFPNGASRGTLDAVIVNTAGGMTGGDRFDIAIDIGAGAHLTVTTAAAEKVYRSLGPDTEIAVRLNVGPDGALAWLPQETILFDQVRLRRTIDADLAQNSSLLLAEACVFGRSAMGEAVVRWMFLRSVAGARRRHSGFRRDCCALTTISRSIWRSARSQTAVSPSPLC